jgi:threonine dehydratase
LLQNVVTDSIVVSLTDVAAAMRRTAERVHVVAEGAAGCAIAAALSGRAGSGKVVAVVSGGNIDLSTFARVVGAAA